MGSSAMLVLGLLIYHAPVVIVPLSGIFSLVLKSLLCGLLSLSTVEWRGPYIVVHEQWWVA